jgi:hypothetical protein
MASAFEVYSVDGMLWKSITDCDAWNSWVEFCEQHRDITPYDATFGITISIQWGQRIFTVNRTNLIFDSVIPAIKTAEQLYRLYAMPDTFAQLFIGAEWEILGGQDDSI